MRQLVIVRGLLMFALLSACKNGEESPKDKADGCLGTASTEKDCLAESRGQLTLEACQKIIGARWETESFACIKPRSLTDCQKAGKHLIWSGELCVDQGSSKNFYLYCIDPASSADIKHTLAVMSRPFMSKAKSASCQEIFEQLKEKKALVYHNEGLVDLSPFQGFEALESLDLWNNLIRDLAALSQLPQLSTLHLGHNRIEDVSPLANLLNLRRLSLFENQISDISLLASLRKLEYLDVSFNRIADLSPLNRKQYQKGFFSEGNPSP